MFTVFQTNLFMAGNPRPVCSFSLTAPSDSPRGFSSGEGVHSFFPGLKGSSYGGRYPFAPAKLQKMGLRQSRTFLGGIMKA